MNTVESKISLHKAFFKRSSKKNRRAMFVHRHSFSSFSGEGESLKQLDNFRSKSNRDISSRKSFDANRELNEAASSISTHAKMLRFSDVEVRLYGVTLGDHPDCTFGPPITLDWDFNQEDKLDIDEYEQRRLPRRTGNELRTSFADRETILKEEGFTRADFTDAISSVKKVRRNRNISRDFSKLHTGVSRLQGVASAAVKKSFLMMQKNKQLRIAQAA